MKRAAFLREVDSRDKGRTLADSVRAVSYGARHASVHIVQTGDFSRVPGSPFAYWLTDGLRRKFNEFGPLAGC